MRRVGGSAAGFCGDAMTHPVPASQARPPADDLAAKKKKDQLALAQYGDKLPCE
jgi:hypothetical protein